MKIFFSGAKAGFTLVELLVIVMILGILSSIALPQYRRSVERARVAEAQTLLRSIYDACERLAWENNMSSCGDAVKNDVVNFRKLDITVKGTFNGNASVLTTENFAYEFGGNTVWAQAKRGDYVGAIITFDGRQFTCSDSIHPAPNACTVWGAANWNEE